MTESLSPEDQATRDKWLADHETALACHKQDYQMQNAGFVSVLDLTEVAIRSTILIAGGATVVGLAFVGSLYPETPELARSLIVVVVIFAIATLSGGLASGFSYLAQCYYFHASTYRIHSFEVPYVDISEEANPTNKKGDKLRLAAMGCIIFSYFFLGLGIFATWFII